MLQDATAPRFEKTMTHTMLQKSERLGIPVKFIRTHGDMLHTKLNFTGPNGHSRPVMLKVRTHGPYGRRKYASRVYLSRGWIEFVKENGFQVGDRIIFWLLKRSTFRVLVCSQLQEKDVLKNEMFKTPTLPGISSKVGEESGRDNYGMKLENGEIIEALLHPKVTTNREITVHKCETNFNPAESAVQQWHWGPPDRAKVVAVKKMSPKLREEDFIKHPGLDSAVSFGPGVPQFVRKLTKISFNVHRSPSLELPFPFVKEHGHKFQAHVFLLSPSGRLRIVSLKITSTGRGGGRRVQIRQGWKDFSLENGFKVGDVLLFTLVGLSKFVVHVFPSV